MEIRGEFDVKTSVERVWASLWDADLMPAWLPGCKTARWEGDQRVYGEVEQSVAQLKETFVFDMKLVERGERQRLRLSGTAQGKTINSDVAVDVDMALEPLETGATRVTYVMKAEISGTLAKVGNFVLKLKAKDLQQRMAQNVRSRLEGT